MFFGYNVGSTIHKLLSNEINLFYNVKHTLIDNFISNLLDDDRYHIFVNSANGVRPDNFITIKDYAHPPVFYDTWIGDSSTAEALLYMHLSGLISVPTPYSLNNSNTLRNFLHICYDNATQAYLQELKIPSHIIPAAIIPEFIQSNIDKSEKTIDIGILQSAYPIEKMNMIVQTLQSSLPNYNIVLCHDNLSNNYISSEFRKIKILLTLDHVSSVDLLYASCFHNTIICTNGPLNEINYRLYFAPTIEQVIEKTTAILQEYNGIFNTLQMEKNKLLLNNPFNDSKQILRNLLVKLSEKSEV